MSAHHIALRQDLIAVARRHAGAMSAEEILAVTAQLVGCMIAYQDQRRITPEIAGEIVRTNIEIGNREVIEQLLTAKPAGSA